MDPSRFADCEFDNTKSINSVLFNSDITLEESQKLYKKWATSGTYDTDMIGAGNYSALTQLVKAVTDFVSDKDNLILDVGAGTGLSGKVLFDAGYTNLHALEPCQEFVEILESKQLYSHVLPEFIGGGNKVNSSDDTYDAVVSSGAFGPGHIPSDAILEMLRLVKRGGHVIIVMREECLWTVPEYKTNLQSTWDRLATEGQWTLASRTTYPNHYADKSGLVVVYKKS